MSREHDRRDEDTTVQVGGEPKGDARAPGRAVSEVTEDGVPVATPAGADEPGSLPAGPTEADATQPAEKVTERRPPLITAVEIENFKGIGRPVRVELRPVTLLFGGNSVGKSTVLHALCYAHEILSHRNVDARKTELGGAQVDLGGFQRFVHSHDLERSVRLRFELNLRRRRLPALARWATHAPVDIPWEDDRDLLGDAESGWLELVVEWSGRRNRPIVSHYEVGVDGELVGRITEPAPTGEARLWVNLEHRLLEYSVDGPAKEMVVRRAGEVSDAGGAVEYGQGLSSTTVQSVPSSAVPPLAKVLSIKGDDPLVGFELELDSLVAGQRKVEKLMARARELVLEAAKVSEPTVHSRAADIEAKAEKIAAGFRTAIRERKAAEYEVSAHYRLSVLLPGIGSLVCDELARFRYLGPLRVLHPGTRVEGRERDRTGWADGSAAWDLMNRHARVKPDQDAQDKSNAFRVRGVEAVRQVSDWLSREDRLDTGYKLDVNRVVLLPSDAPLVGGLNKGTAKDIVKKVPAEVAALLDRIADAPVHSEIQIVETRTGLPVRTSDIGVGISQLLPVVVAVLDPARPGFTAIEQPELHLHPRLQVELGDLFAEQAARGGVLLIETHSEHLLLRIMKRMRQTSDGTLPDEAPEVRPKDVNVLFVELYDDQTLIREMPLNERGELVDAWPGGFFEEDLREIF